MDLSPETKIICISIIRTMDVYHVFFSTYTCTFIPCHGSSWIRCQGIHFHRSCQENIEKNTVSNAVVVIHTIRKAYSCWPTFATYFFTSVIISCCRASPKFFVVEVVCLNIELFSVKSWIHLITFMDSCWPILMACFIRS